jgi:hypothetical protein
MFFVSSIFSVYVYAEIVIENLQNVPPADIQRMVKVNSLKELPMEINDLLNAKFRFFGLADIGEQFNASDMIDLKQPSSRLKEASLSEDAAVLTIEKGGIAVRFIELRFFKDDKGWHLLEDGGEVPASNNKSPSSNPVD